MSNDKSHHPKKYGKTYGFATSVQNTFKAAVQAFNNHDEKTLQAALDQGAILYSISGQIQEATGATALQLIL
jgi:hypothetical protein